jgi:hypothetical protein
LSRRFRLAAAAAVLLGAAACAHVEAPRGGPEMRDPLLLVDVTPDSLQIVPGYRGPAVFEFSARLSERGLADAVLVSPRTSPVRVSHRGRVLRVALEGGWQPGRIYQVTVAPAIQDLWNNRLLETQTLVFSTGPDIPDTALEGVATDRLTGRPETEIRVEAIRLADSLVYATRTDSVGGFRFANVPEGDYRVRAYRDTNRNRQLDPFEPRDTTELALLASDTARARLRVVAPDTTPPVAQSAQLAQGIVQVEFDDYLDEAQTITAAQVRILDPAGVDVPVARASVGTFEDDPDPDGEAPAARAPAPIQPGARPGPPPGTRLPSRTLVVEPRDPLLPGTEYRVVVEGVVNVVGLAGGGDVTLVTPAAAEPDAAPDDPDGPTPPPAEPPVAPPGNGSRQGSR